MSFTIHSLARTAGKATDTRAEGKIPGIVYGPEMAPISISVGYRDFEKLYTEAGESSLISCLVEGSASPVTVLIQDVQHDPVRGVMTHIDFRQVSMNKEMDAAIELRFVGEAPAVKGLGGTLVTTLSHVNVRSLPKDLVGHIDIDLSGLKAFDDVLHIKDIPLPPGMKSTDDPETMIVKVAAPLTEDQLKAMEEEGPKSVEEVEVATKKKEDEGTIEEGEKEKQEKK